MIFKREYIPSELVNRENLDYHQNDVQRELWIYIVWSLKTQRPVERVLLVREIQTQFNATSPRKQKNANYGQSSIKIYKNKNTVLLFESLKIRRLMEPLLLIRANQRQVETILHVGISTNATREI